MRLTLLLFFLVLPIIASAQYDDELVHNREIGINFLRVRNFDADSRILLPGIFYRRSYGRGTFRLSAEATQKFFTSGKYEANSTGSSTGGALYVSGTDSVHWKQNSYDLQSGGALTLTSWTTVQAYVFSDAGIQVRQTDGWYKKRFDPGDTILHPRNARSNCLGLSLGAGIQWQFWKRFALCFETNVFGSIGWTKIEQKNLYIAPETHLDFHPIRTLGISWKF